MAKTKFKPQRKEGRPRKIETPEDLKRHFENYKTWAKQNPYLVHDFVGKDALEVRKQRERPLTWKGFEVFLNTTGVVYELQYYEKLPEFSAIIRACKAETSRDIIEGALAGVYQQNIAARLEGLKDQADLNVTDTRKSTAELFPKELD